MNYHIITKGRLQNRLQNRLFEANMDKLWEIDENVEEFELFSCQSY